MSSSWMNFLQYNFQGQKKQASPAMLNSLPPELIELVLKEMRADHVLPLMLSSTFYNRVADRECIWEALYESHLHETSKALKVAANPELWCFNSPSSRRFLYEIARIQENSNITSEPQLVATLMKHALSSPLIVQAGVYIIRRLAYFPTTCEKSYRDKIQGFRSELGAHGIVDVLLQVLQLYAHDAKILAGALCAIGNISIDSRNSQRLFDLNGIDLIVQLLKRCRDNFSVVDYGCFALCNIAESVEKRVAIVEAGGIQFAMNYLADLTLSVNSCFPPLDLLTILIQDQNAKTAEGPAVLKMVATMMNNPNMDEKLMTHLLTLLVTACEAHEENRNIAIDLGLWNAVEHALSLFPESASVFAKAALCLFALSWQHPGQEFVERRLALVHRVCDAMKKFPNEVFLQRTSAAMLSDYANSDSSLKQIIKSLGGRELVHRARFLKDTNSFGESDMEWAFISQYIVIE